MNALDTERAFRQACGTFATGITVILTRQGEAIHGMTANAFMSVSLNPRLIAVSVNRTSRMHGLLAPEGVIFSVSVLQADQRWISDAFSRRGREMTSDGISTAHQVPVVAGALAWFVCEKTQAIEAGDHTIVIGRVMDFWHESEDYPLIFYRGRYFDRVENRDPEALEFLLLER